MCMNFSFGQYVKGIWVPNEISLLTINSMALQVPFGSIIQLFDIEDSCFKRYYKIENLQSSRNPPFNFFPKEKLIKSNVGYKLFERCFDSKTVLCSAYRDCKYNKNEWYTATNKLLHKYVSGFHIPLRKIDVERYDGDYGEIFSVQYQDVLHYGYDKGALVAIANEMKIGERVDISLLKRC